VSLLGALAAGLALTAAGPAVVDRPAEMFVVRCVDDPAMSHLRQAELEGHLNYVEDNFTRYAVAGPLIAEDGTMTGSLFVIHAEDEAGARAFMAGDPYVSSGLYATITYERIAPVAGAWIGGVVWERRR
jgi:uncharacterized protein YciI